MKKDYSNGYNSNTAIGMKLRKDDRQALLLSAGLMVCLVLLFAWNMAKAIQEQEFVAHMKMSECAIEVPNQEVGFMAIEWTKAEYDAAYNFPAREPQPSLNPMEYPQYIIPADLHYHKLPTMQYLRPRVANYANVLGLTSSDHVVLLGAGFGWECEILQELLPGIDVVGVDTSTHIQSLKDVPEDLEIAIALAANGIGTDHPRYNDWFNMLTDGTARSKVLVLDEDFKAVQSRKAIRDSLLADPTWTITADMIIGFTDAELAQYLPFVEGIAANQTAMQVGHVTTCLVLGRTPNPNYPSYNWKTFDEWRAFLDANGMAAHALVNIEAF